jgi:site-specific DNA recombinase
LFFSVNASLAQFEREEIASRVAASVPIRAKLGKPLGGVAPFGYVWKDKKLVLEPNAAAIRKLVYELFAEHKRKKTVARMLNEKGFRTRDGKSRKGGKFSDTTITRLITDPTAKGEHRVNYTKSLGDGKKWIVKPEHEWIVNRVEPIVSVDLWERCNSLLDDRKVKGERPAKRGKSAFTGLVRCYCGKKMFVPSNTPKWVCYSCRNKIPVIDLDAVFRDELKAFMVSPDKIADYLASTQTGIEQKKALLVNAQKERDRAKKDADRCFELYEAKALTVAQFKERFQPLDARRQQLEREIPKLEAEIIALGVEEMTAEHIASEGRNFYSEWPTFTEERKRSVAELFLKEIVVGVEDVLVNLFTLPVFEIVTDKQRTLTDSSPPPA